MARIKSAVRALQLDETEMAMVQRNDAFRAALDLELQVRFGERESMLRQWWEETNKRISERLAINAEEYEVDRATGKLSKLAPSRLAKRRG